MIGFAPGRANIIGEHVDYNDGFILPFAINRKTLVHIDRSPDDLFHIYSEGFGHVDFSKDTLQQEGGWADYVKGILWVLREIGLFPEVPLSFHIQSDVPIGAGLSSSASIEVATLSAINGFFGYGLKPNEIVELSRKAENQFVGVQCGMMDQFASVMGREGYAVFLDTRTGHYEYLPIHLQNYTFLIVNSGVSHSLGSGEYNKRRSECEECLKLLKKSSFREIELRDYYHSRDLLPPDIFNRGLHVLSEIERALKCKQSILSSDFIQTGKYLSECHQSLRDLYEVSCSEIDFLIEQFMSFSDVLGARIMGGGFGGSILVLIEEKAVPYILGRVRESYRSRYRIELEGYIVKPSNGAGTIER
jgi:galactokinase